MIKLASYVSRWWDYIYFFFAQVDFSGELEEKKRFSIKHYITIEICYILFGLIAVKFTHGILIDLFHYILYNPTFSERGTSGI